MLPLTISQPVYTEDIRTDTFMHAQTHTSSVCLSTWSFICDRSPSVWACRGTDSWGKTFISVAFPSQSVSSLTLTLHSLLITELHWGALQTMWVDAGQVMIEYAIVCIMHSRWGIRRWYEAQILHEGFCSYYCQMMGAASGAVVKIVNKFHRAKSRENVSDWVLYK